MSKSLIQERVFQWPRVLPCRALWLEWDLDADGCPQAARGLNTEVAPDHTMRLPNGLTTTSEITNSATVFDRLVDSAMG